MPMQPQNMTFNQNLNMMQGQMSNQMPNMYNNQMGNFTPCMPNYQNMCVNPNYQGMMGMQFNNFYMNNMNMAYPGYGGFQGNTPVMQNNMQNNMNNNVPNNNNGNQQGSSVLRRDNKLIGNPNLPTDGDKINVFFEASTGNTVVLNLSKKTGLLDALKEYIKKIGLQENNIGSEIVFLFNGKKLDHTSTDPIEAFKIGNQSKITVFDQGNIIGA